jgi:hypothetical protein
VAEVDGEDAIGEFLHLLDDEALSILGPANYVLVFFILHEGESTSRIS